MRKLGIEIECILPTSEEHECCGECSDCYSCDDCGVGSRADGELFNQLNAVGAEVGNDASIDGNGIEVRIGHVAGDEMERKVKKVCKLLNDYGAEVNNSCGLHVHADASEIAPQGDMVFYGIEHAVEAIDKTAYYRYERATGRDGEGFTFLPTGAPRVSGVYQCRDLPSVQVNRELTNIVPRTWSAMRFLALADNFLRASVVATRRKNNYCQPFAKLVRNGGEAPQTLGDVYRGILDRYCGINFRAMIDHGTIENRYHSGSTNAEKIIHWARLWARLVDVATRNPGSETEQLEAIISDRARREMFFALLALPADTERYLRAPVAKGFFDMEINTRTFIGLLALLAIIEALLHTV